MGLGLLGLDIFVAFVFVPSSFVCGALDCGRSEILSGWWFINGWTMRHDHGLPYSSK